MKKNNKYIVWGTGVMGRIAMNFFGKKNIIAFIDENICYQGMEYEGIKVISFEQYCNELKGADVFIVISPKDTYSIEEMINKEKLTNYVKLQDILY